MHSDESDAAVADGTPGGAGFEVSPDKLIAAAKIIEAQANTLADRLIDAVGSVRIDAPAQDVVSVHATEAWNALVIDSDDACLNRVRVYLDGLRRLATRLRAAASQYDQGEEAALAGFADHGLG